MKQAIMDIEQEIEKTEKLIEYYVSKGNPTIEIIEPNQFLKLEELKKVLATLKKYDTSYAACNLSEIVLKMK